jgi:hypothetical protein
LRKIVLAGQINEIGSGTQGTEREKDVREKKNRKKVKKKKRKKNFSLNWRTIDER